MIVDIAKDKPRTIHQLRRITEAQIAGKYPCGRREVMGRRADGHALGEKALSQAHANDISAFAVFAEAVEAELEQAIIDNLRIIKTDEYKAAVQRLARYRLADGRPEQIYSPATYDENGTELTPEIPFIAGIDPLSAQVEQMDYTDPENPVVVMVDNPSIVRDDAERAAAQAIIDAATTQILADVEARA